MRLHPWASLFALSFCGDADDDMVLEVNGRADAIVTFNRRDFRAATERFGIEVLLPGAAIERLGGIS